MKNFKLTAFLLLYALTPAQLSASCSSSTSNNPWYTKAADAFKKPHDTSATAGEITTTGILIYQEGQFRCEALTIENEINWVVAFHEKYIATMLFADITGKSDTEINEAARCLFERIKAEYQQQDK